MRLALNWSLFFHESYTCARDKWGTSTQRMQNLSTSIKSSSLFVLFRTFLSLVIFCLLNPTLTGKKKMAEISWNDDGFVNSSISNKVYDKYIETVLLNEWAFKTVLSFWGSEPCLIRRWPIFPGRCLEPTESDIDETACLCLPGVCFHSSPFNLFLPWWQRSLGLGFGLV